MVSQAAGEHVKVILGGQGGDEIFGGYTRYLIAYFEQCIRAAIDGTTRDGTFVVTYESIIPNLVALRNYKPMLQAFWSAACSRSWTLATSDLINRAPDLSGEVDTEALGDYSPFDTFRSIFNGSNVGHQAYFDKMTHFDFKTLLPALLQVEDRVSMAHGLESRVPLLDHRVVELAATMPADIKFKDGNHEARLQAVRPLARTRRDRQPRTRWASRCRSASGSAAMPVISCSISSRAPRPEPRTVRQLQGVASLEGEARLGARSGASCAWNCGSRRSTTRSRATRRC